MQKITVIGCRGAIGQYLPLFVICAFCRKKAKPYVVQEWSHWDELCMQ